MNDDDDDDTYNNPNLHSEEQDELEIFEAHYFSEFIQQFGLMGNMKNRILKKRPLKRPKTTK
ncbi:hypothetical protein GLOIN_2v1882854 [Rhizophagus irregularis DAOM 181602=DAOM 197198]|uniref:Uncharacterized protein n=1 Tax=Rhizophagus irregularis (strain DAOM 181602 / DAOM 197198 / MUCL 43194) TaxID=747089 RepID=A0A2P4PAP6_RHIID|nr:hypothetical protein GLOIN_2v1882854 [Rhizophagus irregularis DAOM 181602=DAOM 197198]POG62463.1 hypothetical protein GLOIN_2v1882854 [Rhizophagus irregularis DAOM 181602=DAOM 197198]|eukprot:XP_025169329.1 hypothetical protein GLOIN_2v1882854 [Rhizophagus irregularis DAOM 181602=DAOM 197198]